MAVELPNYVVAVACLVIILTGARLCSCGGGGQVVMRVGIIHHSSFEAHCRTIEQTCKLTSFTVF